MTRRVRKCFTPSKSMHPACTALLTRAPLASSQAAALSALFACGRYKPALIPSVPCRCCCSLTVCGPWQGNSRQAVGALIGHNTSVRHVVTDAFQIISLAADHVIKVWVRSSIGAIATSVKVQQDSMLGACAGPAQQPLPSDHRCCRAVCAGGRPARSPTVRQHPAPAGYRCTQAAGLGNLFCQRHSLGSCGTACYLASQLSV